MSTRLSPPSRIASTLVSQEGSLDTCAEPVNLCGIALRKIGAFESGLREHWDIGHTALFLPKDVSSPSNVTPQPLTWGPAPTGQSRPWGALSKAEGRAVCQPHSSRPGGCRLSPSFSRKKTNWGIRYFCSGRGSWLLFYVHRHYREAEGQAVDLYQVSQRLRCRDARQLMVFLDFDRRLSCYTNAANNSQMLALRAMEYILTCVCGEFSIRRVSVRAKASGQYHNKHRNW